MRSNSAWLTSGLFIPVLFALSPTVHGQAPTPQTSYEVCRQAVVQTVGRLPTQVMYFSGVMRRVQINDTEYGAAFAAFLREKYGIPQNVGMSPECGAASDQASARRVIDVTWKDASGRYTYVDTGWTYTPASSAAPAAAQPAPPAPPSETVTFDCDDAAGKFSVVTTFYFVEGSHTPSRAAITLDGKTIEMRRDSGEATGWSFGAASGVGLTRTGSTARLYRGSKVNGCTARSLPSAAATAATPAPAAAARPAAGTAPAAPPAAKAPAATPSPTTAARVCVICRAEGDPAKGRFYNPPVDGADGSYAIWMPSFKTYLTGKYRYDRNVSCGSYPTREAAQADFDASIAAAKLSPTINGLASPVIVTDWKFK